MSKKKGLSADEKRCKLLDLLYEKKEFFQLKELEKIAPKEKGIVAQSVKEVLQSLVDDGLVDSEKIGTSIYFWAFKSKANNARKNRLEKLQSDIIEADRKLSVLQNELEIEKGKNCDTEDCSAAIEELKNLTEKKSLVSEELQKYSFADPEILTILKRESDLYVEAANFWIENIFTLRTWCVGKFNMVENTFNQHFNVPEELDYVE